VSILAEGLLKRWNTLPLRLDMILSSIDPSDACVLGTSINAMKIKM
jgi:hypothetical protein